MAHDETQFERIEGGAFKSNNEHCHQHWGFTLDVVVMTDIQFNFTPYIFHKHV